MLFICYSRCSTCKKAKDWLDAHNIRYIQRDIKEQNPSFEELSEWISESDYPIKRFFNTSGMLYPELLCYHAIITAVVLNKVIF